MVIVGQARLIPTVMGWAILEAGMAGWLILIASSGTARRAPTN